MLTRAYVDQVRCIRKKHPEQRGQQKVDSSLNKLIKVNVVLTHIKFNWGWYYYSSINSKYLAVYQKSWLNSDEPVFCLNSDLILKQCSALIIIKKYLRT